MRGGEPAEFQRVIVELRQYTLRPGQWAVLAGLFERALAEGQEAVGMTILGWFRDLDDVDRFVWLRWRRSTAGPSGLSIVKRRRRR